MMKWAVIATWEMAAEGTRKAAAMLKEGASGREATLIGVQDVEDNPAFHSVGFGGLPGRDGHIAMDAGFMDGDTLHFGAVAGLEGFRSPAAVAQSLAEGDANNFRIGAGAALYAEEKGFEKRNNLTEEAEKMYLARKNETLKAYDGHDTVCFAALDSRGSICTTASTSGLFMKEPGRVGDTPMPGNGFYADSEIGAAAATGMGEEIAKGALSYAVVRNMAEGMEPMEAASRAVRELDARLKKKNGYAQPMSVIALDRDGRMGIGTNIEFTFCTADQDHDLSVYRADVHEGRTIIQKL